MCHQKTVALKATTIPSTTAAVVQQHTARFTTTLASTDGPLDSSARTSPGKACWQPAVHPARALYSITITTNILKLSSDWTAGQKQ